MRCPDPFGLMETEMPVQSGKIRGTFFVKEGAPNPSKKLVADNIGISARGRGWSQVS
jgi:hypothetical protein